MDEQAFGFTVHPYRKGSDQWRVYLPHQCDSWDIAGEDYSGVPQAEAIAGLERFISEANAALAALRSGQSVGEAPWNWDDDDLA